MLEPDAALPPVIPADCATVQLNDVPVTFELNATLGAFPEQIVVGLGVALAVGVGFTVTVTVAVFPVQPFAVGVTV